MSSNLKLDDYYPSWGGAIWWTLTKEGQAWCNLHVKLVWSMLKRFETMRSITGGFPLLPFTWHDALSSEEVGATIFYVTSGHQLRMTTSHPGPLTNTTTNEWLCGNGKQSEAAEGTVKSEEARTSKAQRAEAGDPRRVVGFWRWGS